uniref:Uncharacterized protein n=1 Tax=Rhizophora mucronata TaxID=61149 RepID=A0A2P2JTJ2_RHIMU
MAASRAPMPVPAIMSKKSAILALGSPISRRIRSSRWTRAAPAPLAVVPPPSMLRTRVFLAVSQCESHFCSSFEKISSVTLLSSISLSFYAIGLQIRERKRSVKK